MELTPWFALIGAIFGGVGLKVVESLVSRGAQKRDYDARYRDELREEIQELKKEIQFLSDQLDEWKAKYYALVEHTLQALAQKDKENPSVHLEEGP